MRNGEVAQWLPYLTHGSPGAWWYIVQSGIFDPVVFLASRLLHVTRFIPVFYTLLFLEKLLLLSGTWLLAAEHFKSRAARFAVAASVALTSVWYTGVWWNFHAFLALPMMLFLVHCAVLRFRWTWLVGLSLVLYLQTFGHLSYYLPMTLLFLAAYAGLLVAQPEARATLRERFRFRVTGAGLFVAVTAAFLLELLWLRRSSQEIAFPSTQRGADGSVSLETFLTHGGSMDLRPAIQFFSGLTPHLDFTVFAGFLIAALTIVAVSSGPLSRPQRLFGWLTLLMVLVGTSSPLAVFVYYFWPLGSLFRHLSLVLPVAKLSCVFLAGATLDRLLSSPRSARWPAMSLVAVTAMCAGWFVLLAVFGVDADSRQSFIRAITASALPAIEDYAKTMTLLGATRGAAFAGLSWIVLIALLRQGTSRAWTKQLGRVAVIVLFADVVTYGVQEMHARTIALSAREAAVFQVSDLPYVETRSETTDDTETPRRRTFAKTSARIIGTRYWAEALLWFTDGYRTSGATVFWSTSFESLLDALRRRPGLEQIGMEEALPLPLTDAMMTAIGGFRGSKVRFFWSVMLCADEDATARVLADPGYRGQIALITGPTSRSREMPVIDVAPCEVSALAAQSKPLSPAPSSRNAAFTSNRAEFVVDNPTGVPLLMTYSDSWNEHWSARVNDAETPVWRSNLAYKAVVVGPGSSRVVFEYRDRMAEIVFALQAVASLGLLVFLAVLVTAELKSAEDVASRTSTGS